MSSLTILGSDLSVKEKNAFTRVTLEAYYRE